MKYSDAIPTLGRFSKIIVSGPQRSGTRIASKIIANDFNLTYLDEAAVNCRNIKKAHDICKSFYGFVLQCPGLSAWVHALAAGEILIIFMKRDVKEIIKSEKRINWCWPDEEYEQYKKAFKNTKSFTYFKPISTHKYMTWENYQRNMVIHYIELEYDSLSQHPLFIPKKKRSNFIHNQTELSK